MAGDGSFFLVICSNTKKSIFKVIESIPFPFFITLNIKFISLWHIRYN
jgi:hypothetical protein